MHVRLFPDLLPLLAVLIILSGCSPSEETSHASFPPPAVKTIRVAGEDMPLKKDYPGRLVPIRLAEVRARVSGIVLERQFEQGSDVHKGDVLFEIDPAKFAAAVASAKAQLSRAEAALSLANQRADRVKRLLARNVASTEQHDVALADRKQAQAEVAVAKANLQTAELELSYASVRSPIDGHIGAALVSEGALVRQEDGTQMAIVRDISSLYVDFIAPLAELSRVRREIDSGDMQPVESSNAIELILDDGSTYEHPGRLLFSSAVVDETTGQVLLRAEFENPQGKLLPGTYVRVRVTEGVAHQAVLVPQRAVQWDTLGQASVMTVRDGNAAAQPILTSRSVGNRWLVTQGLKSGDQVIVDGLDRAMPGQPVSAAPAEAAAEKAAERGTVSDCSAAEPCDIPS